MDLRAGSTSVVISICDACAELHFTVRIYKPEGSGRILCGGICLNQHFSTQFCNKIPSASEKLTEI